ncbi:MAG: hypothetical protein KKE20_03545 [Nanoarchaeota archaeon]|nr:hypothetical protein [Nanoarchaeota archaeon]
MGKKIRKKLTKDEIERLCFECDMPCEVVTTKMRGIKVEAYRCPKCKEITFSEKQAHQAAVKLEEKRMEEQYKKSPIRIGHSLGLTFPKEIVKVFGLSSKSKLNIKPKLGKKIIEIKVG